MPARTQSMQRYACRHGSGLGACTHVAPAGTQTGACTSNPKHQSFPTVSYRQSAPSTSRSSAPARCPAAGAAAAPRPPPAAVPACSAGRRCHSQSARALRTGGDMEELKGGWGRRTALQRRRFSFDTAEPMGTAEQCFHALPSRAPAVGTKLPACRSQPGRRLPA